MAEKYHPIPWSTLAGLRSSELVRGELCEGNYGRRRELGEELLAAIGAFRDKAYDYYKARRLWDQRH